jgi:hypothetical protein
VEEVALEVLDPVDVGQLRLGQTAGTEDQGRRRDRAGAGRAGDLHGPAAGGLVPGRVVEPGVEVEPVQRAGPLGDPADVLLDLGARGVGAAPLRVGRERERVQLARYIAGGARVGVVAPGAADLGGLLDHEEVALAVLLELDRGAKSREPGTDDEMVDLLVSRTHSHAPTVLPLLNNRQ